MTPEQEKDAALCEEMDIRGESKDCLGCSCSVCIAQHPIGLSITKIHALIDKELAIVKETNPQMAEGMQRIKEVLK